MSDTGGGHRAAAEAIQEAIGIKYGEAASTQLVDVFKEYAPYPFNHFPAWYPDMIASGARVWRRGFRVSDGARRNRAMVGAAYPYVRPAFRRMVHEHPADLYLSVHPLLILPTVRALGNERPPVITVVTDLVSAHAFWFYPRVESIIVPTEEAYQRALRYHVPAAKVKVIGLPVLRKFSAPPGDKLQLRQALGWQTDPTTVLLMGGGEGMGPIYEIARGIATAGLPLQLALVAGRNEALRARLNHVHWEVPAHVYGFATNIPELMRAADLVVTKAGPASVIEALTAGLPMVLSGALPGQEEGNVRYVVENRIGLWAPGPEKVAAAVKQLLTDGPDTLANMAANARRLARPDAASEIAEEIGQFLR